MPSIADILTRYRSGETTPARLITEDSENGFKPDVSNIWIHKLTNHELRPYLDRLDSLPPDSLPLYGVPFAIKDNIDLAGVPTTAACPDYAYVPTTSAPVVQRLIDAGAIPRGKTNLDQFATGLVGTRSPYPIPLNPLAPDRIPGGSSSGSAVAVATGQVAFALGTDTAGSGRIPAAFNNLWGLKPSRGRLSTSGVVPACRTLDCVSLFATNGADLETLLPICSGYDPLDPFSQPTRDHTRPPTGTVGIPQPDQLEFFGDAGYHQAWLESIEDLARRGWNIREVDASPFFEAARLLYEGPWIAERFTALESFLAEQPDAFHPVTRAIIETGSRPSARDTFAAIYRLAAIRRQTETIWTQIDALITPTAGGFPTLAEVDADPIGMNTRLGTYTNFMNLLDLSAVATPSGFTGTGLPFGITWIAPRDEDAHLLRIARSGPSESAPQTTLDLILLGAHMRDFPLNPEVVSLGATFMETVRTAPHYRMVCLETPPPPRPGLYRVAENGVSIEGERWRFPISAIGPFLATIRAPLGLGQLTLADGTTCHGFLCETTPAQTAPDISAAGSWRHWSR